MSGRSYDDETTRDLTDSDQDVEGSMGVSSERVGVTGGDVGATGTKDTTETDEPEDADVPPEQRPGQVEPQPEGIPPKAGYPSADPREDDEV